MVHKGKKIYLKIHKNENEMGDGELPKVSKKAKVIVRNLPFKNLSEESVENFFKKYGDIHEVKLLKKEDGKFVGCGFVQFSKVSSAAKAIRHANETEMNGRKIVVDWALPKNTFLEKVQKLEENFSVDNIKSEDDMDQKANVLAFKEEPKNLQSKSVNIDNVKIENLECSDDDNNGYNSDGEESNTDDDENHNEDEDEDDEDDDGDYYCDLSNEKKVDSKHKITDTAQNKNNSSVKSDVEDGRTLFIRNIPFSATNEDLKSCVETYGPIEYALICIDKLTDHSKGTGFVKFKCKEDATRCLQDSTKIYVHDNPLTITLALSKSNLENKQTSKKTVKDSRNLYLIREGMVIAGSKAAAGVSAGDMAKRLQLEQWKNQILKNLNMFVSKTRLVIHNLPPHFDDSALRNLFVKYSNPKAVIKEAKVMYDKKKIDASGKGKSKEVGFVTFTKHEDALQALRNINNNPEIFSPKNRPIVAFSIENKAVINSKLKRLERSRAKLGLSVDGLDKMSKLNSRQRRFLRRRKIFIEKRKEAQKLKEKQSVSDVSSEEKNTAKRKRKNSEEDGPSKKRQIKDSSQAEQPVDGNAFTGVISESGTKVKLRSKFKLKNQANLHYQACKAQRRKRREKERKKITFRKSIKEKKGKSKLNDDSSLSKILKKHQENIPQSSVTKKWYDN